MQKNQLLSYIHHTGKLDRESLEKIRKIKEQYPYFNTSRLLLIRNLYQLNEEEYLKEIEIAAAHVNDRRILYELIHPLTEVPLSMEEQITILPANETPVTHEEVTKPASEPKDKPDLQKNIANLLSWQLHELELVDPLEAELVPEIAIDIDKTYGNERVAEDMIYKTEPDDLLILDLEADQPVQQGESAGPADDSGPVHPGDQHSFTGWLSVIDKTTQSVESPISKKENPSDTKVLIDRFIESNPRLDPRKDNIPHVDISEESVMEHDGIFTDTLARIYIKQGYYSKAIFAYEKLILKYPEKSGYFASQIEDIKKLTNKQ
jgi:tetratricopeptide (TPR) repeat protein